MIHADAFLLSGSALANAITLAIADAVPNNNECNTTGDISAPPFYPVAYVKPAIHNLSAHKTYALLFVWHNYIYLKSLTEISEINRTFISLHKLLYYLSAEAVLTLVLFAGSKLPIQWLLRSQLRIGGCNMKHHAALAFYILKDK